MILDDIYLIQIVTTITFCIAFCVFDIKKNYVPDELNYMLIAFGFTSNLMLTLITSNIKFILFSFISWFVTYLITLMMWTLNVWGGGDVKLFASIASVIPSGINSSFFNISPLLSFYPFSFTVMLNSILVSFPFLMFLLVYLINKKNVFNENTEIFKGFFNYKSLKILIDSTFNEHINIRDLEEGMMVNNYYFDDEQIKELIESSEDTNLKVFKSDDDKSRYYFKTLTAGGVTKRDMYQLKIMNAQKIISNQISIRLGFPFVPAILAGLIVAIFYGDLSMLILKNFVLVS
ncbi:prepilin peptidase [Methanobrevibacter millerae]|uniref:Preflagellin peptidase FlaK n=1 Tax=Methanobrevibacter millerae TaxID=230361 RepID=A0A1G5V286_9EURY|nr:A24 family peptidase [Methanobrevibacter millerae]SDA39991.1 preflagellin peptidase FlaK [Methanobrevibacter millerae]